MIVARREYRATAGTRPHKAARAHPYHAPRESRHENINILCKAFGRHRLHDWLHLRGSYPNRGRGRPLLEIRGQRRAIPARLARRREPHRRERPADGTT